jgi:hypothetical protein
MTGRLKAGRAGERPIPDILGILATFLGLVFGEFSIPLGLAAILLLWRFLLAGKILAGEVGALKGSSFWLALTLPGSVLVGCVFSDDDATRFNASIKGFRVLVSVVAAGVDDLVVLAGRAVDVSLCAKR